MSLLSTRFLSSWQKTKWVRLDTVQVNVIFLCKQNLWSSYSSYRCDIYHTQRNKTFWEELIACFQSQESELLYDWRFTANQFVLATRPLRLTASNFIFQRNTCIHSPYVTSSMTRGRVCRLQFLLVLASAVILRSEFRGTHVHISLSQIRDSHNLVGQVPVFIFSRNRMARFYPQALGSLFVASYDSHGYGGGILPRPPREIVK
jgi:hypothetical protein